MITCQNILSHNNQCHNNQCQNIQRDIIANVIVSLWLFWHWLFWHIGYYGSGYSDFGYFFLPPKETQGLFCTFCLQPAATSHAVLTKYLRQFCTTFQFLFFYLFLRFQVLFMTPQFYLIFFDKLILISMQIQINLLKPLLQCNLFSEKFVFPLHSRSVVIF